ncbi:MAG: NrfD/PsrC family molybdoenzyme membrane anchor subunit [Chloroflexota bacterium]
MDTSGHDGTRTNANTYYGQPVIKAPHWRWLIIFYFFLGGIVGGSYSIGSIASLVGARRSLERSARYLALVALIPCPVLLILDLGRPERALNMLRVVKLKSPMSLGSWTLLFLSGPVVISAILETLALARRDTSSTLRTLVGAIGLPFSLFFSGYTGVLLAATNIPLWWRSSPFLGPLFVTSAWSSSCAALSLILRFQPGRHDVEEEQVARLEALSLAAEVTLLTATVVRLGKIGRPMTAGKVGLIFWPVTLLGGVVAPLVLRLTAPARGSGNSRGVVAAGLVLLGGFSLRVVMILAGRESARRPEDYFALTAARSHGD